MPIVETLESLGERIARSGFAGVDADLAAVASMARGVDVSPVLIDVMLGSTEPTPARVRAFGRIACDLLTRTQERVAA